MTSHVDEAAADPGDEAERAADQRRQQHRGDAAEQRQAAAIDEARPDVPAGLVGAEQKPGRADRFQPTQHAALQRVVGRRPGRENGEQDHAQQDAADRQRDAVARQALGDGAPIAARLGAGAGVGQDRRPDCGNVGHAASSGQRRMRGSISACTTSTSRLISTKKVASTSTVPCNTGMSRRKIARFMNWPEPGQLNTVSTRIEPPSR